MKSKKRYIHLKHQNKYKQNKKMKTNHNILIVYSTFLLILSTSCTKTDFSDIPGLKRSGNEIYVQDMMETPNKFYFRCGYKQGFRIVSVDKKTSEVSVEKCLQPATLQELAKTTLFHGLLGSRSYNNFPIWGRCVQNELIQVITPSELSLYREMKDISIPSFLQNVEEEGNPLFIIYKLTY